MSLESLFQKEIQLINSYLREQFPERADALFGLKELGSSVRYSLLSDGKRFRPVLSLLTANIYGEAPEVVLPYGSAVELIHTYSLVHDDLPAMDDDDERRGKPTNHKVYGEAMAILTGDGLLTDAFRLISESYKGAPERGLEAIGILARAAGLKGMVGGQAIDIQVAEGKANPSLDEIKKLHALKTGALITAAVEGAAVLCGANNQEQIHLKLYGENLGLAFQLADDILDHEDDQPELQSFPTVLGLEETKKYLDDVTEIAVNALSDFGKAAEPLRHIAYFNKDRLS